MEPRLPIQEDIVFLQKKDGYKVYSTETDLFIETPNGAHLTIYFHPYKSERYTLNYNGITCSKTNVNAYVIYCDVVDALNGDLSWKSMKGIIDTLVNDDICRFPFV